MDLGLTFKLRTMAIITREPAPAIITRLVMAYYTIGSGRPIEHELVDTYDYWKNLFELYNKANDSRLKMGCRPCYLKVYLWFQKEKAAQKKDT